MVTFIRFLRHTFDFKGKASRSEFYLSVLSFILIGGLLRLCEALILAFVFSLPSKIAGSVSIVAIFCLIALYSLSCRRLRYAGYRESVLRWITFPFGPTIAIFISLFPNEIKVEK